MSMAGQPRQRLVQKTLILVPFLRFVATSRSGLLLSPNDGIQLLPARRMTLFVPYHHGNTFVLVRSWGGRCARLCESPFTDLPAPCLPVRRDICRPNRHVARVIGGVITQTRPSNTSGVSSLTVQEFPDLNNQRTQTCADTNLPSMELSREIEKSEMSAAVARVDSARASVDESEEAQAGTCSSGCTT